jgi:hypothetical protein
MTKALTAEQADKIIPRVTREQARREAALRVREEAALEELEELGFRIGLYEPRTFLEPDELRGIAGGWKVGTCYAVADSITGKRKTISAMSAVDALDQAKAFLHYQETRLSPELRFTIAKGESVAIPVVRRVAGDTAETAARRESTQRRILGFASGVAEVVDSHGDPIGEDNHASQFSDA